MKPQPRIAPPFVPGERAGLALCSVFLLWANLITPLWADDYCRTMPPHIGTILRTVWGNYNFWTGRWFTTLITFLFLDLHHYGSLVVFAVVNMAIFAFVVHVVMHMCRDAVNAAPVTRKADGLAQCLLVFLMLWWLPRTIGEVALWKTGAIGYLWPVAGEIWVLARILTQRTRMNMAQYVAVFLIATFLEPLSVLLTLVLMGACVLAWKRMRPVPWALLCSHGAGTMVLGLAPGNYVRMRTLPPSPLPDRLDGLLGNMGSLFDPYWLPFVLVIGVGLFLGRRQISVSHALRAGHAWVFAALAVVYMGLLLMFPRAAMAARVSFPASVLLACYLSCLLFQCPLDRTFRAVLATACVGLTAMHLAIVIPDLTRLARISHDWVTSTRAQVAQNQPVVLPRVTMGPRHKLLYVRKDIIFVGINPDPHSMLTACFAQAMGASSVRSVP